MLLTDDYELLRRGQHDAALMVDRYDQDSDAWAARPGFQTEPKPACRAAAGGLHVPWGRVADALRKHSFAVKLAEARARAERDAAGAAEVQEAQNAMCEQIDGVFVGRGWHKGFGRRPGAAARRRVPHEGVTVRS